MNLSFQWRNMTIAEIEHLRGMIGNFATFHSTARNTANMKTPMTSIEITRELFHAKAEPPWDMGIFAIQLSLRNSNGMKDTHQQQNNSSNTHGNPDPVNHTEPCPSPSGNFAAWKNNEQHDRQDEKPRHIIPETCKIVSILYNYNMIIIGGKLLTSISRKFWSP